MADWLADFGRWDGDGSRGSSEFLARLGIAGGGIQHGVGMNNLAWLGVGWHALITKQQVGLGLLLMSSWWIYREEGVKTILWTDSIILTRNLGSNFLFLVWKGAVLGGCIV